ncbi:MAG: hypothetical protein IJ386_03525 [Clostridia bacterium]|nr:hypothetical protein [Clostridia bacterium]
MTTQTSFSDKKSANRRFFNAKYFRFSLKTGWPLLVVFIFVFMLSLAVPTVSFITEEYRRLGLEYISYDNLIRETMEFLYPLGLVNVVISMFGGLLCGMTTMRFTNNKVAVNFYHSLPMRRESIFITSTLQSFTYYVIAFAAGLLFTFATISIRLGHPAMFISPLLLTFEYGVLFFFLVYSMTLFAASLTGTGFMRFVGAGYVIFLPLVMFTLFIVTVGSCGIYNSILDVDYYLSTEFMILLCSPLRLINLLTYDSAGDPIFAGAVTKDIIIVFITAVVYYGLAFLLYCVRHSESASHPIIWKPARFVFKYSSMFMGGTLFALMFYGMFESVAWMVFGIIIGSVIVFMFTNGIINKSARAIFKGLRGLGIYMAVMAVVTVVFYCDVFGIFASVPNGSLVSRVELCVDYNVTAEYGGDFASKVTNLIGKTHEKELEYSYDRYYIDNEKLGEPLVQVYTDQNGDDYTGLEAGRFYSGYQYDSMPVEAVFHTKFGIPYAIRIFPNCQEVHDLVKYVYDTNKSLTVLPEKESVDSGYVELYFARYGYEGDVALYARDGDYTVDELFSFVELLSDPTGVKSESPIVGQISLYIDNDSISTGGLFYSNSRYQSYFIHANDYEVLNIIADGGNSGIMFQNEQEVLDYYIEKNGNFGLYIIDNEKNESIHITDAETVRELVSALYSTERYNEDPALCTKEHRYNVYMVSEEMQDYYDTIYFRKGAVPEVVTELFGE